MKIIKNPKGGDCCPSVFNPDDIDDLILELHRLKSLNLYLMRELSRVQAENQRIYLESIY